MADFTLKKDGDEITIDSYTMVPLVMHYNEDYTECSVYKLEDYTDELAQEHGIHEENPEEDFSLTALEDAADQAGELHTEWEFQTDDTDEENTDAENTDADNPDTEDSTGNNTTDSQGRTENSGSLEQDAGEDENSTGTGNNSTGRNFTDTQNTEEN